MESQNKTRSSEIFGDLRLPVVVAPMFLVSGQKLVIASCRQGLIGSFPVAYPRTIEELRSWFEEIEMALMKSGPGTAPYAANLIVHQSNERMDAELDLICEFKVPIVIASVGNPRPIVERVHAYGGIVWTDVGSLAHARKAADRGVDGLILLAAGAGGHTGWINPFAFVRSVREFYDGPVMLAGAIADGTGIYAARVLGATLAFMGTRFISADESDAQIASKEMVVRSEADDIVLTSAVSGLPGNWMKESLELSGYTDLQTIPRPGPFNFTEKKKAWKDVWGAGHGAGTTKTVSTVAEIVAELEREYREAEDSHPQ
jgi:nitronate monooxygenase